MPLFTGRTLRFSGAVGNFGKKAGNPAKGLPAAIGWV
jgi:hypothetical protein